MQMSIKQHRKFKFSDCPRMSRQVGGSHPIQDQHQFKFSHHQARANSTYNRRTGSRMRWRVTLSKKALARKTWSNSPLMDLWIDSSKTTNKHPSQKKPVEIMTLSTRQSTTLPTLQKQHQIHQCSLVSSRKSLMVDGVHQGFHRLSSHQLASRLRPRASVVAPKAN